MLFVALISLPIFYVDNIISRFEGFVLFSYYVVYTIYIILNAMNSAALPAFTGFMYGYAALTVLVLLISVIRHLSNKKRATVSPK
jgi:cation:H+ antiporter